MDLKPGVTPDVVSENVRELMKSGQPQKQAIAAALAMKRKSSRAKVEAPKVEESEEETLASTPDAHVESKELERVLAQKLMGKESSPLPTISEDKTPEEPVTESAPISEEALNAIAEKKKRRRYA